MSFLRHAAIAAVLLLSAAPAMAESAGEPSLENTVKSWEGKLSGRIGVAMYDGGSGKTWSYRENELFLMNSTVKVPICAAVLSKVETGKISLNEQIKITESDLLSYAPVTKKNVGASMSVGDLCFATIDMSDNTAANLLIKRLGGSSEVTGFLREHGDEVSRSDRLEPELNIFAPGDPRDTTSPAAIVATLDRLFNGEALAPASREQLADWMRPGGVTGKLLRPSVPKGWDIGDKSGSGATNRNLIAVVTPPSKAAVSIGIFISETEAENEMRNEALADIGKVLMTILQKENIKTP